MICDAKDWRSPTRGLKATWGSTEVDKLAADIWDSFPKAVRGLLADEKFKGAPLVTLEDSLGWRIKVQDLVNNKILLMPIVSRFPDRTPSLFFLADTILALQDRQTETRFA